MSVGIGGSSLVVRVRRLARPAALGLVLAGLASGAAAHAAAAPEPRPAQVSVDEQRIEFEAGTDNATREGNVAENNTDRWILRARAGQTMQLTVDSVDENTAFAVFAPDRTVLAQIWTTDADDGTFWTGTLPMDGDYSIEITSLNGPAFYRMKVWIDAGYIDPLGLVQRVSFAPGTDNGTVSGAAIRTTEDLWFVTARAGQTMNVSLSSVENNATFNVYAPDGTLMTGPEVRTSWSGVLPVDGDYRIGVAPTSGNATYTLRVQIPGPSGGSNSSGSGNNSGSSSATVTRRMSFSAGSSNGVVNDSIAPGQVHRWVLGAAAGQTMAVFIESDTGDITAAVYDPTGVPLANGQYEVSIELVENGDYVVEVNNDAGIVGAYTLTVWIS